MTCFDLDLAFAPAEVAAGVRRLLDRHGCQWTEAAGGDRHEFAVTLPSGGPVRLEIAPLPAERHTAPALFPARTLLTVRGTNTSPEALEGLRRAILLAFLRVTG